MRAAIITELGAEPVLGERPDPVAGEGGVLVHVSTAALNPADLVYASGIRLKPSTPFVPGIEAVGRTPDGKRVYFYPAQHPPTARSRSRPWRTWGQVQPLADDITDEQALCLGVAGTTAWLALTYKAGIQPGESVLVLGATGSVGQIAVQAAKALGARRVVAAGRDRETLDTLLDHGADTVVTLDEGYESRLVDASEGGASISSSTLCSATPWWPASGRPGPAGGSSTSECAQAGPSNSPGSPSKGVTCSRAASTWCRPPSRRGPSATCARWHAQVGSTSSSSVRPSQTSPRRGNARQPVHTASCSSCPKRGTSAQVVMAVMIVQLGRVPFESARVAATLRFSHAWAGGLQSRDQERDGVGSCTGVGAIRRVPRPCVTRHRRGIRPRSR